MADFDETQIREFVGRWFSGDKHQRERRELFLSELAKTESEGLRELARVPLLLALLCLGFEETLRLSSRRVELYEEALDALLKKWDSGRNIRRDDVYRELTIKRKEGMLAQVAAETFDRGEYFIPQKTLARSFEAYLSRLPNAPEEVDGEVVLRAIIAQHGLFLERARDVYSFAHLTFQEYFAARYVVENEARGTLPRLIAQYANPAYREVFLLTAAQTGRMRRHSLISSWSAWRMRRGGVRSWRLCCATAARKAATASGAMVIGATTRSVYTSSSTSPSKSAPSPSTPPTVAVVRNLDLTTSAPTSPSSATSPSTPNSPCPSTAPSTSLSNRAFVRAPTSPSPSTSTSPSICAATSPRTFADLLRSRPRTRPRHFALALAHDLVHSPHLTLARDIALANGWPTAVARVSAELEEKASQVEDGRWLANTARVPRPSANLGDAEGQRRLATLAGRMAATGADFDRKILEGLAAELDALLEERCDLVFPAR